MVYQLDAIEYFFVFFQLPPPHSTKKTLILHYTTRPPNLLNTHTHSTHTHILHAPYMGYTLSIPTKIHKELYKNKISFHHFIQLPVIHFLKTAYRTPYAAYVKKL